MPELEDRVWQWLLKRVKGSASGKVLTKGLMAKLRSQVINDPVAIRKALMLLRDDGHIQFTPDERGEPVSSYITVIKPAEQVPPHVESWSSVLEEKGLAQTDIEVLMPAADAVSDLSQNDMKRLLDGLVRLRHDQGGLHGQPAYLISAKYLLGSSKLLTGLPARSIKAFGIDPSRFPAHPPYVVVGGCARPQTVILVENPAAFELAVKTPAAEQCVFVATFGFGLSKTQNEYGNQLAGLVESQFQNAIGLVREPSVCPPTRELLAHPRITFWGDLDTAGVHIYLRLKRRLPQLELSALYQPMLDSITDPERSHPYAAVTGKTGQADMQNACPDQEGKARWLLGQCQSRGVDQESVSAEDICCYAEHAL